VSRNEGIPAVHGREDVNYHIEVPNTGDQELQLMLAIIGLMNILKAPAVTSIRVLRYLLDRQERYDRADDQF